MLKLNTLSGFGSGVSGAAVTVAVYGYSVGGNTGAASTLTERMTFSTGVFATAATSNLNVAMQSQAGHSDTTTHGYSCGGDMTDVTERMTFSTGAFAANTDSDLSGARSTAHGLSDGATYGYVGGSSIFSTTIERMTYSTSVNAVNTDGSLSVGRMGVGGVSDGVTYGYWAGGYSHPTDVRHQIADRITFADSTTAANTDSDLAGAARHQIVGLSGGAYGYFSGGNPGGKTNITDRITFSTGVTALNTDSDLSEAKGFVHAFSDNITYGYLFGGNISSPPPYRSSVTDRLVLATSVNTANTDSDLTATVQQGVGISDGAV